MKKTKPSKLLDANTAVESYLDHLLQEATSPTLKTKPALKADVIAPNVHILETPLTKIIIDKAENEPILNITKDSDDSSEVINELESQHTSTVEELSFPIQCIMFKVSGNLLAIPLVKMGSVVPFADRLTQLPHSPNYFKGLLKYREHNVRVADSSALLMGTVSAQDEEFSPSHLLVFENEEWAISCDELLDVVSLNEEDIKWHSDHHGRLSLGTIKTTLALILSPDAICNKLINTDG